MLKQHETMVIFDFDGVIVDTWWLTRKTTLKAFPELTEDLHRSGFEGNIYEWEKALTHLEKKDIDYFEEFVKEVHLVQFFDVKDVITELSKKHLLTIVSSSPTNLIEMFLEREGLRSHFQDILGKDVHESKHEKIQMLFKKYDMPTKECVMVTDTTGDAREARMAGVDSILVSWGFHDMDRLRKVDSFRIVHEPKGIVTAVEDYFAR